MEDVQETKESTSNCGHCDHRISELLQELSDCREDERNGSNQILSVIGAASAILGIILTANIFMFEQKFDDIRLETFLHWSFTLSCIVFCAAISYVVTLGTTAVLRYHYIRNLEDRLYLLIQACDDDRKISADKDEKENTFVHWFSFCGALVTRNTKHLEKSAHGRVYYIAYTVATLSVVVFCAAIIMIQFALIGHHVLIDWIAIFLLAIVFLGAVVAFLACSFVGSGPEAGRFFQYARNRRKERIKNLSTLSIVNLSATHRSQNGKIQFIRYLVYPKTKDPQKPVLILIGYILYGLFLIDHASMDEAIRYLSSGINLLVFFVFVFDFLIYQARYQINDILGLKQDIEHTKTPIPGVKECSNEERAILVQKSLLVALARLAGILLPMK